MAKSNRSIAKSSDNTAKLAKALNVDPDWLRTGKGSPTRRLTYAGDEAEAMAICDALTPDARKGWLASGCAMVRARSS